MTGTPAKKLRVRRCRECGGLIYTRRCVKCHQYVPTHSEHTGGKLLAARRHSSLPNSESGIREVQVMTFRSNSTLSRRMA